MFCEFLFDKFLFCLKNLLFDISSWVLWPCVSGCMAFSKSMRSLDSQVTWRSRWAPSPKLITLPSAMVIGVVKLEMHLFANATWLHDRLVTWLDGCGKLNLSHTLLKSVAKVEIKLYFNITWSMSYVTPWVRYPQPKSL